MSEPEDIPNQFVLVYAAAKDYPSKVLVVEKQKPDFQVGRLNLVGGKQKQGESPEESAVRELAEEAGLQPSGDVRMLGEVHGSWGWIGCVLAEVDYAEPHFDGFERVFWADWSDLHKNYLLMANLHVIVPLMMARSSGWKVNTGNCIERNTNANGLGPMGVHDIMVRFDTRAHA